MVKSLSAYIVSLLLTIILSMAAAKAGTAADLRSFTGQRTRMVWAEDSKLYSGTTIKWHDTFCHKAQHRLVGIDTDDGKGIRTIRGILASYANPMITPKGDRIVYTDWVKKQVCILNFDGSGHRVLLYDKYCSDLWMDPATGKEYLFCRTSTQSTTGSMVRYQMDNTGNTAVAWNKTSAVGYEKGLWFQVSGDGKRAAGSFPWDDCGYISLLNGTLKNTAHGCWPGIAPDNSYISWVFQGDHRTSKVFNKYGNQIATIDLHSAPGIKGWEVYHPRWTSNANFVTMTGPYDQGTGDYCTTSDCGNGTGKATDAVNLYIGKLNTARTDVIGWYRVTSRVGNEYFGHAWFGTPASSLDPRLNLNTTSLQFAAATGGSNPSDQTVTATAVDGLDLSGISVSENAGWLTVGVSGTGTSRTLTNKVNIAGLSAGTKSATVTVSADGKSKQYTVSLSLADLSTYHKKFDLGASPVTGWESGAEFVVVGENTQTTRTVSTDGVANAAPAAVYQTCRYLGFNFQMPIPNGAYTVRCHTVEWYYTTMADATANRKMDIWIEGTLVENDLSPAVAAGALCTAAVLDYQVTITDGTLNMTVANDGGNDAYLMGLEVIGGTATTAMTNDKWHMPNGKHPSIADDRLFGLDGTVVNPQAAPAGIYLKVENGSLRRIVIH